MEKMSKEELIKKYEEQFRKEKEDKEQKDIEEQAKEIAHKRVYRKEHIINGIKKGLKDFANAIKDHREKVAKRKGKGGGIFDI